MYWKYRDIFLRYRWQFLGGFVALLLTNLLGATVPQLIQKAIHLFEKNPVSRQTLDSLHAYLWMIFGVAVGMMLIRLCSRLFLLGIGRIIEHDLRNVLYQRLLTLPVPFFIANPTGELMSRLTNDVQAIRFLCGGAVMLAFNALFAYVARVPMMVGISPVLTLCAFVIYPVAAWLMIRLSKRVRASFFHVQDILGDISTLTQENLSGMNVIQGYAKEEVENRRFERFSDRYFQANRILIRDRVEMFLIMSAVSGLGLLITLAEGGREAIHHQLQFSQFIQFTLYLEQLAWPTMSLGWTLSILQQGNAALQRIDKVLSAPLPPSKTLSPSESKIKDALSLEIRHLNFHYQNPYLPSLKSPPTPLQGGTFIAGGELSSVTEESMENQTPVLKDISFSLPVGTIAVIVGPVGSGKSTLLSLLPRLYEVPEGAIFLGGEDINSFSLEELRRQVILMPQHSFLFSSTIGKNIAYGNPIVVEKEIVQAAQTAGIHDEILGFQQQYETVVGERGILVSGGQRQRLSLARALLVSSAVLLLDDPFSNVDTETEQEILSVLEARKAFENKLTLIATHRLSIARRADVVILMDQGRIIATGSHAGLLATQPLYQRLNRREQLESEIQAFHHMPHSEGGPS